MAERKVVADLPVEIQGMLSKVGKFSWCIKYSWLLIMCTHWNTDSYGAIIWWFTSY